MDQDSGITSAVPNGYDPLPISEWMTAAHCNPYGNVFGAHICFLIDRVATEAGTKLAAGRNLFKTLISTTFKAPARPTDQLIGTWLATETEEREGSIIIKISVDAKRTVPSAMGGTSKETIHIADGIGEFSAKVSGTDTVTNRLLSASSLPPLQSPLSVAGDNLTTSHRIMPHDVELDGSITWPLFDHIDTSACRAAFWVHSESPTSSVTTVKLDVRFLEQLQVTDFLTTSAEVAMIGKTTMTEVMEPGFQFPDNKTPKSMTIEVTADAHRNVPSADGGNEEVIVPVARATVVYVGVNNGKAIPIDFMGNKKRFRLKK